MNKFNLFKFFGIDPIKRVKDVVHHECGENGCSIKIEKEIVEEYPELTNENYVKILEIILEDVKGLPGTYQKLVEYLEKVKQDDMLKVQN